MPTDMKHSSAQGSVPLCSTRSTRIPCRSLNTLAIRCISSVVGIYIAIGCSDLQLDNTHPDHKEQMVTLRAVGPDPSYNSIRTDSSGHIDSIILDDCSDEEFDRVIQIASQLKSLRTLSVSHHPDPRQTRSISQMTALEQVGFVALTDEDLEILSDLPNLTHLSSPRSVITDRGVDAICKLRQLASLTLSYATLEISNDVEGAWPDGLHELRLDQAQLSSGAVARICRSKQLGKLDLTECSLDDDECRQLIDGLPLLEELNLSRTRITDRGLESLQPSIEIRVLDLWGTRITDAAVPHIVKLQGLEELNLSGTQVTDAGVSQLTDLPQLKMLYADCSGVTPAGLTGFASSVRIRGPRPDNPRRGQAAVEAGAPFPDER
jgi:hypothetical protein